MKKAFTILELIFVIIILGILAAIALPKFDASKDDAELSKSLNNLKTLINDIKIYTLKNDKLASVRTMSNVTDATNIDLGAALNSVDFKVGGESNCVQLIFVDKTDFVLMGVSSNAASKKAIEDVANGGNISALENVDFTSTSANKTCVAFSKNENFKALASQVYIVLGAMK